MNRLVLFVAALLASSIAIPFLMEERMLANDKSPQEVTLPLGATKRVGAGRAQLWYAGGHTGGDFEIQCKAESKYFEPSHSRQHSGCGVTVELLKVEDKNETPHATFKVTW